MFIVAAGILAVTAVGDQLKESHLCCQSCVCVSVCVCNCRYTFVCVRFCHEVTLIGQASAETVISTSSGIARKSAPDAINMFATMLHSRTLTLRQDLLPCLTTCLIVQA